MADDTTWAAIELEPSSAELILPDDDYHLTLAYMGKPSLDSAETFALQSVFANWVLELWPFPFRTLDVSEFALFGPNVDVPVALIRLPLVFEREELVDRLDALPGVTVASTYRFEPHVSLRSGEAQMPLSFHVKGVFLVHKGRRIVDFRFE